LKQRKQFKFKGENTPKPLSPLKRKVLRYGHSRLVALTEVLPLSWNTVTIEVVEKARDSVLVKFGKVDHK